MFISKQKTNITFTYHHPCHGKAQGIYKENINFLKNNYDFMDINDESCCGFGGLGMQVENFDKSLFIANEKYKNIQKTKASIISAECSACKMQIENVLKYNKFASSQYPILIIFLNLFTSFLVIFLFSIIKPPVILFYFFKRVIGLFLLFPITPFAIRFFSFVKIILHHI